jgi:hypothetical protein
MLPWVSPFQGPPAKALPKPSPGLLSHASRRQRLPACSTGVPESQSALAWSRPNTAPKCSDARDNPLRVPAPAQSRHSSKLPTGLCVHLSLRRTLLPPAQRSWTGIASLYRSCRDRLRCRTSATSTNVRWCPSEFSVPLLDPRCCHRRDVLFWGWLLVQSSSPIPVWPLLLRPSHFAVGRFPGSVVFPKPASLITVQQSVEPSLRVSPPSRVLPS